MRIIDPSPIDHPRRDLARLRAAHASAVRDRRHGDAEEIAVRIAEAQARVDATAAACRAMVGSGEAVRA